MIRLRPRNRFVCCKNQTLNGKHGIRLIKLECIECESRWHDQCLLHKYGATERKLTLKSWRCPDCIAYKDNIDKHHPYKTKSKKKHKKKKSLKKKKHLHSNSNSKHYNDSHSNSSGSSSGDISIHSSDSDIIVQDAKNKQTAAVLKKRKQKEKSIKNRLNNIKSKYKFKFSESMLEISDDGTDDDFDGAFYLPKDMPKSDKALENLRSKKAAKSGVPYFRPKKNSEYYEFEKQSLIDLIYGIAAKPKQFKYNPRFGWSITDVAQLGALYLYELRKKDPAKHINVTMRNAASVKAKLKSWDDPKNKESREKEWIAKYETAKQKMIDLSVKAASDVNEELINFGEQYSQVQLKNVRNQLKKLHGSKKDESEVGNMFKDALAGVAGLIKELKQETKAEKKEPEKVNDDINNSTNSVQCKQNDIQNAPVFKPTEYNPYIDSTLMNNASPFSPAKNQQFIEQHQVKYKSINSTNNTNDNIIGNAFDKLDGVCGFITKMNNLPPTTYDEENESVKSQASACDTAFFAKGKATQMAIKYDALKKVNGLSDKQILEQLAKIAQLL